MAILTKPKPFKLQPWDKPLIQASMVDKDIHAWTKGYFDINLLPWQQYFYVYPAKDKMAIAGIRTGKSFMAAIGALHFCQTHPGAKFLNACISIEQAKIVYYTCMEFIEYPRFRHWIEDVQRSPYPMIRLINGSELHFRSVGFQAILIRGQEYDFINLDECSYVHDPITVTTLKGRLMGVNRSMGEERAREGWFWQLSSPKGKGGWVYDRFRLGDPAVPNADPEHYLSLRVRTSENTHLSQEQLDLTLASYTESQRRQELEGEFLDSDGSVFRHNDIMHACSEEHEEVRQLLEGITRWKEKQERYSKKAKLVLTNRQMSTDLTFYELEPEAGHRYLQAWDLGKKATDTGRNASVGMVWDVTDAPWRLVAYRYAPNLPYLGAVDHIVRWSEKYNYNGAKCYNMIDATGPGDPVNEVLSEEHGLKVEGLKFSGQNKPEMLSAAAMALERSRVRFPFIQRFVDQLDIYVRDDKDIPQDTVMCFAMAMLRAHEMAGLRLARVHDPVRTSFEHQSLAGDDRVNYRRQPLRNSQDYQRYLQRRRATRG